MLCPHLTTASILVAVAIGYMPVVNPRHACAARVTGKSVRPSVCYRHLRNKAAKKRFQRVQCHTGLIFKMAIFVKVLRSKVMAPQ